MHKAGELHRAVQGAVAHANELSSRISHLKVAVRDTPSADESSARELRELEERLADLNTALTGDTTVASRNEPVAWSVAQRAALVYGWLLDTRSPVPAMYERSYDIAATEFRAALGDLRALSAELIALEERLEGLGAPWTPGRLPDF